MLQFLFDTDHLTLFQHGHAKVVQRITSQATGSVGVAVITMQEALRGRLAVVSRARTGADRIRAYDGLLLTWALCSTSSSLRTTALAKTSIRRFARCVSELARRTRRLRPRRLPERSRS